MGHTAEVRPTLQLSLRLQTSMLTRHRDRSQRSLSMFPPPPLSNDVPRDRRRHERRRPQSTAERWRRARQPSTHAPPALERAPRRSAQRRRRRERRPQVGPPQQTGREAERQATRQGDRQAGRQSCCRDTRWVTARSRDGQGIERPRRHQAAPLDVEKARAGAGGRRTAPGFRERRRNGQRVGAAARQRRARRHGGRDRRRAGKSRAIDGRAGAQRPRLASSAVLSGALVARAARRTRTRSAPRTRMRSRAPDTRPGFCILAATPSSRDPGRGRRGTQCGPEAFGSPGRIGLARP
jgi:hypothetical protein